MTNPDNVGGLPELPAPDFMLRWDSMRAAYYVSRPNIGNTDVYTADQMRAYGELCRAAPAGGDSWPLEVGDALLKWNRSHPAGPLISIGYEYGVAAKVAEIMRDSAPAGSGEVEEVLKKCDSVLNDMRPISPCLTEQMEEYFAEIRALLRKLQQGADGVDWRAHYRFQTAMRYMDNNDKMTLDRAQRMADEDIVRMERAAIAASQGQEGGK